MEINIVHIEVHLDDQRRITALEIKIKSEKDSVTGNSLLATVSTAFYETTLLVDEGRSLKTILDKKRKNVVDLIIDLEGSNIELEDVANFIKAFEKAIDKTELF